MTLSDNEPNPESPPPRPPAPGGGYSVGLTAMVLLALSAAVVFWAGLSLGGQTVGRDDRERTAIEAFTQTYQRINDQYIGVADPGELLDAAICGMFETLDDPYSVCMPPGEYESRFEDVTGEFGGIGAVMDTSDASGAECQVIGLTCGLRVLEVLEDTPAQDAGLEVDDRISAVDGAPLEGLTITDSVLLIRGPRGSDVVLTLERDGQVQDLTITRDTIVAQDVRSAVLEDGAVGYLSIENFSSNAAEDFRTELRELTGAGIDKLVLDVRGDPGGFVDAAIDVSSQFLADGAVFWEEDADGTQRAVDVTGGGLATDPGIELMVLVDGGSASASEIVAGALQDAGRAQLVGDTTFGKGTVQEWTELPGESGGFRLSVAKWLTRGKTWIDGVGLSPDVPVASDGVRYRAVGADIDPDDDPQLQEAVALLLGRSLGMDGPVSTTASPGPSLETAEESPPVSPVPSASPAS
jgi:carboxyl-terminal processing protease